MLKTKATQPDPSGLDTQTNVERLQQANQTIRANYDHLERIAGAIEKLEESWELSDQKFKRLRKKSEESRAFASACQDAWNCGDLEEMIQRRDQLRARLQDQV